MAIETTKPTNALARFDDVRQLLSQFPSDKFISLVPTVFQERSDLYVPAAVIVTVDPESKQDVYDSPERNGTVSLRGRKQEQIGAALGVKWLDTKYKRDPESITATVYAEWTDAIGDRVPLEASATEYLVQKSGRTVSQYPDEKAETRARARIIRKLTGQPMSFTKDELKRKAFIGIRWQLDDKIPEVREAIITRGRAAASGVFGHDAPLKAIDAGHEGPDDQTAAKAEDVGPEIPDEPAPAVDTNAIITTFRALAAARPDQQKASDELLTTLVWALADVFGIPRAEKATLSLARKGVASVLFGTTVSHLTAAQASVVIEATKDPSAQAALASLADIIGLPQTLASAARAL